MCSRILSVLIPFLLVCSAFGQQSTFTERLRTNRYELRVEQRHLSGTGASVLESAVADAQFVLVGEDHGIAQVPDFVGALCSLLAPRGFHTMAIEAGPLVTSELEKWAQSPDGRSRVMDFEKKFPDSIAFFNMDQEFGLLKHCSTAAGDGKFHLWGLDQEFLGSPGFIFKRILETHPGKEAEAAIKDLIKNNDDARAKAAASGKPDELFMLTASDAEVEHAEDLLRTQGNAQAQQLFAAFTHSRAIYAKFMSGDGSGSNRQRSLMMKANFVRDYKAATLAEGKPPKVLFKFGGNHMYKGLNQLHNNDIGNYVLELAEGQGSKSVNILILATSGSQLAFAGVGKPYQPAKVDPQDKNSDIGKLKPMFENMNTQDWTMYDLRGMRKGFSSLGEEGAGVENIIFAYDFLVLIPDAKASTQIR